MAGGPNDLIATWGLTGTSDWAGNSPNDLIAEWGLGWWQTVFGPARFTVGPAVAFTVAEDEVRFTVGPAITFALDD